MSRGLLRHEVGSHTAKQTQSFPRGYTFPVKIDTFGFASIYQRRKFDNYNSIVSYGGSFTMSKRTLWIACATIAASSLSGVAVGADPSMAKHAVDDDDVAGLSEIVVTATRRPTYLQETPIAITAFTSGEIDRQHIEDLTNLAIVAPSLVFTALSPKRLTLPFAAPRSAMMRPGRTWVFRSSSTTFPQLALATTIRICSIYRASKCCVGRREHCSDEM